MFKADYDKKIQSALDEIAAFEADKKTKMHRTCNK
jgi:hypothetical protein